MCDLIQKDPKLQSSCKMDSSNTSILDKIVIEEQKLSRIFKQRKKNEKTIKILNEKIEKFK